MNRSVVITGASRGLGLSLAEQFLRSGDHVSGISRTKKYWAAALGDLSGQGPVDFYQADLTHESAVRTVVSKILRKNQKIDILIHAAGYGGPLAPLEKMKLTEFEKTINQNLISAFLIAKYSLPVFQKQKSGFLIQISSMAGQRAVPRLSAYSASKFGVCAITQATAKENDKSGICFLTVCPGGMNTKMRADLFGAKDARKQQSTQFVAEKILDIINGRIPVNSGSEVIIRHGKITSINPLPGA